MARDRDNRDETALAALFAAADARRPAPSDAFLRTLKQEAEAAVPAAAAPVPASTGGRSFGLRELFVASGLTAGAVLGMWIGFAMPETLAAFTTDDPVGLYTFLPGADLTAALSE